ncbi:hypothetical protein J437_LFUL009790 [Ladona fulva]|uniref:Uncharacterized protein n=1 Tax=Ladona fulva TaxID=123851 RepID=A0A8K0K8C1_LADFU|nr:hypothetical protein J437_LFUL009790 [Ladona fulva]
MSVTYVLSHSSNIRVVTGTGNLNMAHSPSVLLIRSSEKVSVANPCVSSFRKVHMATGVGAVRRLAREDPVVGCHHFIPCLGNRLFLVWLYLLLFDAPKHGFSVNFIEFDLSY